MGPAAAGVAGTADVTGEGHGGGEIEISECRVRQ